MVSAERAALLDRRRDVEDHDLVDPLDVVARRQLRGIAGAAQPFEVDALDDRPVAHVEAGDDALFRFDRFGGCEGCDRFGFMSSRFTAHRHEVAEHLQPDVAGLLRVELNAADAVALDGGGEGRPWVVAAMQSR